MKVSVTVKTKAKKEGIEIKKDNSLIVRVNALPSNGEANKRVIELLSKYFNVAKTKIELCVGHKSKHKVFIINIVD